MQARSLKARILTAMMTAAILVVGPVTAANADTGAPTPTSESDTVYTPMVVAGYDAKVAEANGFKIVTHADGSQESVPVTGAAAAQHKRADQLRAADQKSVGTSAALTVCGDSWLSGAKVDNNVVVFQTGFIVYRAAYEHTWTVYATGAITGNSWSTSGPGPASGNRSWEGGIGNVIGPGIAGVPWGSWSASVILVDGTVCWSDGPNFAFG